MSAVLLICACVTVLFTPWLRVGRWALRRSTQRRWGWLRARRRRPVGRPLEQIARDARRLSLWYRTCPRGQSFAKYEAHRRAYDDVLAEACRALRIDHLLGVLEPGTELDAERSRIEWRLTCAGLELELPL